MVTDRFELGAINEAFALLDGGEINRAVITF
jgi:Zn-dependent alcohol dehydrogenase